MSTVRLRRPQESQEVVAAVVPPPNIDENLRPGDSIEIAVTAEVRIDGDNTWIKYGVRTHIAEGETAQEAHGRAMAFQQGQFRQTVFSTVDMIREMSD